MPFLGHHLSDALDVSPDHLTAAPAAADAATIRARQTVQRFALDASDEQMLLELLGLVEPTAA